MKKLLIVAVSVVSMAFMYSCAGSCHTCTIAGTPVEYCPDDVETDQQAYMDAAELACDLAGGTWN